MAKTPSTAARKRKAETVAVLKRSFTGGNMAEDWLAAREEPGAAQFTRRFPRRNRRPASSKCCWPRSTSWKPASRKPVWAWTVRSS